MHALIGFQSAVIHRLSCLGSIPLLIVDWFDNYHVRETTFDLSNDVDFEASIRSMIPKVLVSI